jgi:hypothetical protein
MSNDTEWLTRPVAHRLATVFGILVLIFCFIYFFELASFPFSLDEEWAAFRKDPSIWIAQGRWGAFLIEKYLLPQSAIPFVPQMIFGFACAASFLMIMRMLGRDILALSLSDYASFVIFCAFPTWFFLVEFSSNIGAVGIGLFAATGAVHLAASLRRDSGSSVRWIGALAAAGLLGGFAIATYQTLLFYMAIACLGLVLADIMDDRKKISLYRPLSFLLLLMISLLTYFIISLLFKYLYSAVETYTNVFFNTGYFIESPTRALGKTFTEALGFYGISGAVYRSPIWAVPLMLAAGAAALVLGAGQGVLARLAVFAGGVALLLAPFSLNPFFAAFVLGRTMVATPIAAWFMCYFGLSSRIPAIRTVTSVALALAILQIVYLQNKNQASSYFLAKHDLLVATSIYDRFGDSPAFKKGVQYPIAVFGGRNFRSAYPVPETSNANASFFGAYVGNNQRIRAYLRLLGLEGLRPMTDTELDSVIGRLSSMPIWPAAGSVVLENGVLLVRLGRQPGPSETASLARIGAKAQQ